MRLLFTPALHRSRHAPPVSRASPHSPPLSLSCPCRFRRRSFIEAELLSGEGGGGGGAGGEGEEEGERLVLLFSHGVAIRSFVRGAIGAGETYAQTSSDEVRAPLHASDRQ